MYLPLSLKKVKRKGNKTGRNRRIKQLRGDVFICSVNCVFYDCRIYNYCFLDILNYSFFSISFFTKKVTRHKVG